MAKPSTIEFARLLRLLAGTAFDCANMLEERGHRVWASEKREQARIANEIADTLERS